MKDLQNYVVVALENQKIIETNGGFNDRPYGQSDDFGVDAPSNRGLSFWEVVGTFIGYSLFN